MRRVGAVNRYKRCSECGVMVRIEKVSCRCIVCERNYYAKAFAGAVLMPRSITARNAITRLLSANLGVYEEASDVLHRA
jgi:hypothetical protein